MRSLISDTPVGSPVVDWLEGRNAVVVCAVHDVRIPSAITAPPNVRRSEYPFIDSAGFKLLARSLEDRVFNSVASVDSF